MGPSSNGRFRPRPRISLPEGRRTMPGAEGFHVWLTAGSYAPGRGYESSAGRLPPVFAGTVRTLVAAPRPSPVFPDRMDQPYQHVHVHAIDPASREAHHVLLFILAATRARPNGEAENPVCFFPVAGHEFTPK